MDDFADAYLRGETPIPCVRCNQTVKFRDLLATARGARRRRAGDRPLCAPGRRAGGAGAAPRRRPGPRPELFPVRHHAASSSTFLRFPLGGLDKAGDAGAGRALRPAGRGEARQPGHLLRAERHLRQRGREAAARARPSRATSSALDGRVLGRHDGIIHFTVGQRRGLGIGGGIGGRDAKSIRSTWSGWNPRRTAWSSARATRSRGTGWRWTSVNWLGRRALPQDGMAVAVKLRSTMAPVAATHLPGAGWWRGGGVRRAAIRRRAGSGLRFLRRRPGAGRRLDPPRPGGRRSVRRDGVTVIEGQGPFLDSPWRQGYVHAARFGAE